MSKYQNAKIYKIVDNTNNNIYIGSTYLSLQTRLTKHKCNFNCPNNYCSSYEIIKNNDYKIELIENYPCNNKKELEERENYHIKNNICINIKGKGFNSKKYYINNKDKINNQVKQWRINNKEYISNKQKEKTYCLYCNKDIKNGSLYHHNHSKKHIINFINY